MSSPLLSPRAGAPAVSDLGARPSRVTSQRIGRSRERRRRLSRWRRHGRVVLGTLVAAGALAAAGYWLLTTPRLAVAAVEVEGASRVPSEQIVAAAGITPGTNVLRIDLAAATARIEAMPQIRRAEIVRTFPNRVTIVVEERRPFTLVHAGHLHWLDEDARLIGEERAAVVPPVPVISGLTEEELASMRSSPSPKARAAIAVVRALLRSGGGLAAEISEIDMSRREGPVLYTVDGVEVRLGAEQWEERLGRLEGVLAQLARHSDGPQGVVTGVDLRFRDQVVLQRGGSR